jgi:hypothetical protein
MYPEEEKNVLDVCRQEVVVFNLDLPVASCLGLDVVLWIPENRRQV